MAMALAAPAKPATRGTAMSMARPTLAALCGFIPRASAPAVTACAVSVVRVRQDVICMMPLATVSEP
jgi:hypothetical protein